MSSPYTGFIGNVTTQGDPLFDGVARLYVGNPNGISGAGVVCCSEEETFAVARIAVPPQPIPLPAGGMLLGSALLAGGTVGLRRRR